MGYPFGKDIKYTFYPIYEDGQVDNVPAQTATLYVYANKPSRADVINSGAGSVSSASGTWAAGALSCDFTITAISDPSPSSETKTDEYWVAVKFILQTAGQNQYVIRSLDLERVGGHHKVLDISEKDLINIYPASTTYATTAQLLALIAVAKAELQAELKSKGFKWAQIYRPDQFKSALSYSVLSKLIVGQIKQVNDQFDRLYNEWKSISVMLFNALKIEYDADDSGNKDETESADICFLMG